MKHSISSTIAWCFAFTSCAAAIANEWNDHSSHVATVALGITAAVAALVALAEADAYECSKHDDDLKRKADDGAYALRNRYAERKHDEHQP